MNTHIVVKYGNELFRVEDGLDDELIGTIHSVDTADKGGEFETHKWFHTYGDNRDFTISELKEIIKLVEEYEGE